MRLYVEEGPFEWADLSDGDSDTLDELYGLQVLADRTGLDEPEDRDALKRIVLFLQRRVPHIWWRLRDEGRDYETIEGDIRGHTWRVICVPPEHHHEAEFVFERFLAGEDLEGYGPSMMYPEVFVTHGLTPVPAPTVLRLFELLSEYERVLVSSDRLTEQEALSLLRQLLPELYAIGGRLPRGLDAPELMSDGSSDIGRDLSFGRYDSFTFIDDPYDARMEEGSLSDAVADLYRESFEEQRYWYVGASGDVHKMAAAVESVALGFDGLYGWGSDVLRILTAVHAAINRKHLFRDEQED